MKVKVTFLVSFIASFVILGNFSCKSRKFSAQNAWETVENKEAAVAEIKKIIEEEWKPVLNAGTKANEIPRVNPLELTEVAGQFADALVYQKDEENNKNKSNVSFLPDDSVTLETRYNAYVANPSQTTKDLFRSGVIVLFYTSTNLAQLMEGTETKLQLAKRN